MTADQILRTLQARHSEDIFIPECKDGASGGNFSKLDAWVMPKSWAHPALTGYEIKVSRSDFLGDEKWRAYLPMCNYLYFAAPSGLISPQELAADVGLIEHSKKGSRMVVKKKAAYREIAPPTEVFRYVLMWRARIGPDRDGVKTSMRVYWEKWMADKKVDHEFGAMVRGSIKRRVLEEITIARARQNELERQIENLQGIRLLLQKLGMSEDASQWGFERKLQEFRNGLKPEDVRDLKSAKTLISKACEILGISS